MIRNYLLIAFRNMRHNKLFILINVLGMGIAIACCIVVYLAYQYDATFDSVHRNKEKIYRVSAVHEFENDVKRFGYVALPLGEIVKKTFDDVKKSSRYIHSTSNFKRDNDLFVSNLSYVDPDFFQMFSFDFVAGSPAGLEDKTSVFISESMATKLFGSPTDAVGRNITQVYGTELKEVKIAAVFKEQPMNSSFYRSGGSAYMNFENCKNERKDLRDDNWKAETTLFVQINEPEYVSNIQQQLRRYTENNNKARNEFQVRDFVLEPLATMAHRDRSDGVQAWTFAAPPVAAIFGAVVMGALILLIACFNLTNTAIAISSRRLKEIGIRKVMGSVRLQLIVQFLGETTLICFLGLIVGLGIADLLIEGWNTITMNMIRLRPHSYLNDPEFIVFLTAILILTGVIAGSYPAFYISRFQPVNILKGKVKFGGTNYFTRILLGLQLAFSLMAIVSAIGFYQNARYQQEYDLGFDIRGSVVAWINNETEFQTYRNAIQANPDIISIAGARSGIFTDKMHEPVRHGAKEIEVDIIDVGENYLKTMDLKLLSGRDFAKDSETDYKESIIITQKMADVFGWENPLGKEVILRDGVRMFVIGVVRDVYAMGLWKEMEPMMIRYARPEAYSQIVISTDAAKVSAVNAFMTAAWNGIFPYRLYNGRMLVSELNEINALNSNIVYLYGFLGAIAMMLSSTGLFTLVSLNIINRMKEIGVRKVLGASVINITRIINMEFMIILIIASIVGCWAGLGWTSTIMSTVWKYYQGVNILTFVIAMSILLLISFVTIGYKVLSVSMMNPVNILRDE
jgi:putative ABC transport system permease protein